MCGPAAIARPPKASTSRCRPWRTASARPPRSTRRSRGATPRPPEPPATPQPRTRPGPHLHGAEHGRSSLQHRRHHLAQSFLARLRAAHRQGLQRQSRVRGRLGRRGLEDARAGPARRQRQLALRRRAMERPAHRRAQQHRADHRSPAGGEPARDRPGQARLAGSRADRLADGALQRAGLERDPAAHRGYRRRRGRAELRLPARHERARHGRGGRPGARIRRDDHALGEGGHQAALPGEAHPQHQRHPHGLARGLEGRRRWRIADQHHQLDRRRRPGPDGADADRRRQGHPRRLLRPGREADRAEHGGRDRARSANAEPADLGHRRHFHLARRGRVHRARRRQRAGLHGGDALRIPDRLGPGRRAVELDGREGLCHARGRARARGTERDRLEVPEPQVRHQGAHRPGPLHPVRALPYRLRGHLAPGDHAREGRAAPLRGDRRRVRRVQFMHACLSGRAMHHDGARRRRRLRELDHAPEQSGARGCRRGRRGVSGTRRAAREGSLTGVRHARAGLSRAASERFTPRPGPCRDGASDSVESIR
ncbi:hypothetical protein BGLA2_430008 [Burkholderia gladioli]|nr:hypothetical protein BGLA2_430008 [Burkholderia gladioli]